MKPMRARLTIKELVEDLLNEVIKYNPRKTRFVRLPFINAHRSENSFALDDVLPKEQRLMTHQEASGWPGFLTSIK